MHTYRKTCLITGFFIVVIAIIIIIIIIIIINSSNSVITNFIRIGAWIYKTIYLLL